MNKIEELEMHVMNSGWTGSIVTSPAIMKQLLAVVRAAQRVTPDESTESSYSAAVALEQALAALEGEG